jgi:hypothetical protein
MPSIRKDSRPRRMAKLDALRLFPAIAPIADINWGVREDSALLLTIWSRISFFDNTFDMLHRWRSIATFNSWPCNQRVHMRARSSAASM